MDNNASSNTARLRHEDKWLWHSLWDTSSPFFGWGHLHGGYQGNTLAIPQVSSLVHLARNSVYGSVKEEDGSVGRSCTYILASSRVNVHTLTEGPQHRQAKNGLGARKGAHTPRKLVTLFYSDYDFFLREAQLAKRFGLTPSTSSNK